MRYPFITALFLSLALCTPTKAETLETAIFAGGCFWCVEKDLDHIKGVTETISGYAGGTKPNPTYKDHEGYKEAVKVTFDADVVSYDQLVAAFLRTIDVLDEGGQFCDRGDAYKSAIFTNTAGQITSAETAIKQAELNLKQPILTPIIDFTTFTNAEDYHQNYYQGSNRTLTRFGYVKQSDAYVGYREGCGRNARVKQVWGSEAYKGVEGDF
jgi:peptide-methionine (S)-S-oxide reductase